MRYKLDFAAKMSLRSPSITGAVVSPAQSSALCTWQPSTWPAGPPAIDASFIGMLRQIFEESVLGEINNVIADVQKSNGNLEHRGHVIAIALMCSLDAIASYGYRGHHSADFIRAHFPPDYFPFADEIYTLYRVSLVHKWNLFAAALYPDDTGIRREGGSIGFGILGFFAALVSGTEDFLDKLGSDASLQRNTLNRYEYLRKQARP